MYGKTAARIGILAGVWLAWACGGGGGGGTQKTSYDLNGSYAYSLTPGTVTGNGADDCYPSDPGTGTVDITWTTGADQCQVVIDGSSAITATVSGDTMSYSKSEANYLDCDMYQESASFRMTSASAASGTITWRCSWVYGGSAYSCSAIDTIALTRK